MSSDGVSPTGPQGQPPVDPNQDQDDQAQGMHVVLGMDMNDKEYKQFMKNMIKQISQQIHHDMQKMKKALEKARRMQSGGG